MAPGPSLIPTGLAIDSSSTPKVLVNVSGLSDLISSWQWQLPLMLWKVPVNSETSTGSLNGLCTFHKSDRRQIWSAGWDMIEFTLKCWCAWKKEENDNNDTNNKWAEPKPSLCSLHIIKFNPHNCPGRELLVSLNRQENQGCQVLSKLDQSDTAAKQ